LTTLTTIMRFWKPALFLYSGKEVPNLVDT